LADLARVHRHAARADLPRQGPTPHLFQLRPGRHLLGEQCGLNTVEEPLEPTDQLRLSYPQLCLARHVRLVERYRQPVQFRAQLR